MLLVAKMKPFVDQSSLFKTLAHPARLAILEVLRDGEQCVCHIEAMLKLRQAYISQHLMVLREAGLVEDRRDGWNMYYRVTKPEIYVVLDTMTKVTGDSEFILPGKERTECPCPKCNGGAQAISSEELSVISS
jgi:DNA-binding transcriptional ArsR family regulator